MKRWLTIPNERMELSIDQIVQPAIGEVKVKIKNTYISSTDLAIYQGQGTQDPIVTSRIAVGLISEVPNDDNHFMVGERVLLTPYVEFDNDVYNIKGVDTDGYMADYVIVPEANVLKLPESISDNSALFAEYIAIAIKAFRVLKIKQQEYIAIFGSNVMSNILAQLAIYNKAIPIVIGKSKERLEITKRCNSYYTIDVNDEKLKDRIKSITSGKYVGTSIFTFSELISPSDAFAITKRKGKLGVVGNNPFYTKTTIDLKRVFAKSMSLYGISDGFGDIETALNLLANNIIKVTDFIGNTTKFEDIDKTMRLLVNSDNFLKTIVEF